MTRDDFGDWMSPILVKEFRQGLRARLFVFAFLGIQMAMAIGLAFALAGPNASSMRSMSTGVFWFAIGLPLGLIWPVASFGAINSERRQDTLELLLLSRLTPRRIVVGKWIALLAQAALLAVAVLPYLFFRYFIGGVDLTGELTSLGLLLTGCALSTLFGVALSAYLGTAGVIIAGVLGLLGLQFAAGMFFSFLGGMMSVSGLAWNSWLAVAFGGLYAVLVGVLCVEAGAAKIAPESLRYSPRSRLCAVVLLAVWLATLLLPTIFPRLADFEDMATVLSLTLVWIVCLISMMPRLPSSAGPFLKFGRFGRLGRLLAFFFGPGWPAGVFFSTAMVVVVAALTAAAWNRGLGFGLAALLGLTTAAAALFSIALVRRLCVRMQYPVLGPWLWVALQFVAWPFFAYLIDERWKHEAPVWLALLPVSEFLLILSDQISGHLESVHLMASSVVLILGWLTLLVMAAFAMSRARALHREAEQALRALPADSA